MSSHFKNIPPLIHVSRVGLGALLLGLAKAGTGMHTTGWITKGSVAKCMCHPSMGVKWTFGQEVPMELGMDIWVVQSTWVCRNTTCSVIRVDQSGNQYARACSRISDIESMDKPPSNMSQLAFMIEGFEPAFDQRSDEESANRRLAPAWLQSDASAARLRGLALGSSGRSQVQLHMTPFRRPVVWLVKPAT